MAYEKTNAAFGELNQVLFSLLEEKVYHAAVTQHSLKAEKKNKIIKSVAIMTYLSF